MVGRLRRRSLWRAEHLCRRNCSHRRCRGSRRRTTRAPARQPRQLTAASQAAVPGTVVGLFAVGVAAKLPCMASSRSRARRAGSPQRSTLAVTTQERNSRRKPHSVYCQRSVCTLWSSRYSGTAIVHGWLAWVLGGTQTPGHGQGARQRLMLHCGHGSFAGRGARTYCTTMSTSPLSSCW